MHGDLRGFYGAPVTYALALAVGACSGASLVLDSGRVLALDREAVLRRMQYWRLITHQLTFHHGLAVSFGLYLLFQFRVLERQLGSRKFGNLLVFVFVSAGVLQLAALLSAPAAARALPGGPYAQIGALAVFFNRFIPKLQPRSLRVYGLNFSDKSSTYLVLLVLLGRNLQTLWPFAGGALVGVLFSSTPLSNLRLPSFVLSLLGVFRPLFEVEPPSAIALQRQRRALEAQRRLGIHQNPGQRGGPAGQGFRDQLLPGAGGAPPGAGGMLPPHLAAQPPSEDAVQQLMALGFDREHALEALQSTQNNVEAAANRLLNGL